MIQHHANIIPYGLSPRFIDTYNTTQQRDRYKVHIILNNYTLNRILKQKKEIRLQYTHLNFLLI